MLIMLCRWALFGLRLWIIFLISLSEKVIFRKNLFVLRGIADGILLLLFINEQCCKKFKVSNKITIMKDLLFWKFYEIWFRPSRWIVKFASYTRVTILWKILIILSKANTISLKLMYWKGCPHFTWLNAFLVCSIFAFLKYRNFQSKKFDRTLNICLFIRGHPLSTYAHFQKTKVSYCLRLTSMCAYHGVRNVNFSKYFAHGLNEWSLFI